MSLEQIKNYALSHVGIDRDHARREYLAQVASGKRRGFSLPLYYSAYDTGEAGLRKILDTNPTILADIQADRRKYPRRTTIAVVFDSVIALWRDNTGEEQAVAFKTKLGCSMSAVNDLRMIYDTGYSYYIYHTTRFSFGRKKRSLERQHEKVVQKATRQALSANSDQLQSIDDLQSLSGIIPAEEYGYKRLKIHPADYLALAARQLIEGEEPEAIVLSRPVRR